MYRDAKKITFIIETLEGGGAERVTSILVNKFFEYGFKVNVIILLKKDNEYFVNNNISRHYLNIDNSNNKFIRLYKRTKKINMLLKKSDSEIIISLAMPTTNILLLPSLISHKRKVILSERNDPKRFPKSPLIKKIRNILYSLAERVVFQTNDAKDYFSKKIQEKAVVIPNPIKEDLPQRYTGERKKEIVNFCRLDSQKNLPMLIDAFAMISKEYPDYSLVIYGKGPLEEELKEYADKKNLGTGKIVFKGYSSNIHNEIKCSAMFVSTSDYEGISNSMLESLAIGLPTICTDCPVGGARMFIKPYKNGLLVPVRDTNALYEAMKVLIENKELSDKISKNATIIKEELSSDKIFREWLYLVENI